MANEMKNIAGLFKNARTRIIVILTFVLILLAIVVAYFKLGNRFDAQSGAELANLPGSIRSIPGSLNQTEQYAKLQQQQNIEQAKRAEQTGGSAIPTIIRSQQITGPNQPAIEGGASFSSLLTEQTGGLATKKLLLDELKNSKCSPELLEKAKQQKIDLIDLRKAGCTAAQLLKAGFTAQQLKDAGFTVCDLKDAGLTADQLTAAGFSPDELRAAGFSPLQVLAASTNVPGLPEGVNAAELVAANCDVDKLKKARDAGVNAETLRRITGCSATALKAAGYTAAELKKAGYSAAELAQAGFTPQELKTAGFTDAEIAAIKKTGCSKEALIEARKKGISAAQIRKDSGCSASALAAAGYTAADLKAAGFGAGELRRAGFTAQQLKDAGFSPKELRNAGFSAAELKDAGFTAQQLRDAGFTPAQLKAAGFTAQQLKDAGFSAAELKAAGFSPKELKDAGFTASQLKAAGVSAADLKNAGFSPAALRDAGFTAKELAEAGLTPAQVAQAGFPGEGQAQLPPGVRSDNPQLQQVLARQAVQISEQQSQQKLNEYKNAMQAQAQQLLAAWEQTPLQTYQKGVETQSDGTAGNKIGGSGQRGKGGDGTQNQSQTKIPMLAKAGDIAFAVLNTSINSDERGPILATIVSGKLNGGKLLGSFQPPTRDSKKVILTFNVLSLPDVDKTININAVAIDPKTARTALATGVDNHYFQRFGLLFAAAFAQGFGQAVIQSGSTIQQQPQTGVNLQSTPPLNTKQKAQVALGQAGQQFTTVFQPNTSRPVTVYVKPGISLGILFQQDVQAPAQQQ